MALSVEAASIALMQGRVIFEFYGAEQRERFLAAAVEISNTL